MRKTIKHLTEKEIITLLLAKEEKGLEALYELYGNCLFGLIYNIIKHNDFAEIVLQDTFLKIWNKIDTYSPEKGKFLTWSMNIARNTSIDMLRSKNYNQMIKLTALDEIVSHQEKIQIKENLDNLDLKEFVAKLDKKCREIIELVYFKGYTGSEVAKELNIPLGTVKSRIRKGFIDLRTILKE
ncbi:MAG: RNA polymerase sigma factor [Saprospiraceae bacterium]